MQWTCYCAHFHLYVINIVHFPNSVSICSFWLLCSIYRPFKSIKKLKYILGRQQWYNLAEMKTQMHWENWVSFASILMCFQYIFSPCDIDMTTKGTATQIFRLCIQQGAIPPPWVTLVHVFCRYLRAFSNYPTALSITLII